MYFQQILLLNFVESRFWSFYFFDIHLYSTEYSQQYKFTAQCEHFRMKIIVHLAWTPELTFPEIPSVNMETISRNSTIFTFFPPLLRDPSSPVSIEIFFASFIPWSLLGNARIGVFTRKTDFPNLRHHVTILPEAHVLDCSDFYSRQSLKESRRRRQGRDGESPRRRGRCVWLWSSPCYFSLLFRTYWVRGEFTSAIRFEFRIIYRM